MNIILDIDDTICFDGQQINQDIIDRLISLHNIGHRIIFLQQDRYETYCLFYLHNFIDLR